MPCLWWIQPAVKFGWATNSDWYIVRCLLAFSFLLGLPIFNAVIMGDPVIRDFRTEVDPLIFSKPVTRAQYLLGKFFGNFFVLVCCQAVFPITQLVLQAFPISQMIVLPFRVFPYFKHFFFFVVISHLVLAALYFAVGTLTRNSKIVYGLAACFYPIYIAYGLLLLRPLPFRWRAMLDPMLLGTSLKGNGFLHTAEFLNQYVVPYTADMIANRVVMIGFAAVCLTIVYIRFTITEKESRGPFSVLNLSTRVAGLDSESTVLELSNAGSFAESDFREKPERAAPLPAVTRINDGWRANLRQLCAALKVEVHLLRAEKSLIVFLPLSMLLSFISLPFSVAASDVSYSAAYASATAGLVLFLMGLIVFYMGEAMHRDRETKVEPILWSAPAPNSVLLLSKYLAIFLLAFCLVTIIGLTAIAVQLLRRHTPVEISAYLITYTVILMPSIAFVTGASLALNVLLRNKYLAYVICIAIASGLFYLYTAGYNHWLYNPLLFQLWDYSGLVANPNRFLQYRVYVLAWSAVLIAVAHLCYPRRSGRTLSKS